MDKQRGFKGISFPFRFDGRGGVATSTTDSNDFSHINESIQQIILTSKKERVMELDFGSDIRSHLFRMTHDSTDIAILKYNILEALEKYEPRVEVLNINIINKEEIVGEGKLEVVIDYRVIRYLQNGRVTIKL